MSHRKFEKPRSGNLGFLPRKRCRKVKGKVKSFPLEQPKQSPHLTAFMGYKVGSTHTVRDLDRQGSKRHLKEICEQVTLIETPPLAVVGIVGYRETISGLKAHKTIWASKLDESFRRKYLKAWFKSKQKSFTKHAENFEKEESKKAREEQYESIIANCQFVRVITHTQPSKIPVLGRKRAHVMEIQINGGSTSEKIEYAKGLLEQTVSIHDIFKKDELIDIIGITRGRGFKGVISRWGVTKLPRKTHKGLRKVACIGSWHPARVSYTVARAGQKGYHHRTQYNNKIFMIGKDSTTEEGKLSGKTAFDLTEKSVNPLGGFPQYGYISNEFVMLKGAVVGPQKRCVVLRKSLNEKKTRKARENIKLKFIDTASKLGKGRFQTADEKKSFMGPMKKDIEKKREEDLKRLAEERKAQEEADKLAKESNTETTASTTTTSTKSKKKKKKKKKVKKKAKTTPKE